MPLLRVALPLPLPKQFDYHLLDADETDVGRFVRVPFGRTQKTGLITAVLPTPSGPEASPPFALKSVLSIVRTLPALPPDWLELVGFASRYYHVPLGQMVCVALPSVWREAEDGPGPQPSNPWLSLTPEGKAQWASVRRKSLKALLLHLEETGPARVETLRPRFTAALVREAQQAGLAALSTQWPVDVPLPPTHGPPLTPEQANVLAQIRAGLACFSPFLLHGVTGSGKTEVYLRLAETVLEQGLQVLFMVPEIGLTPQFEARVRARFPHAHIVCLHSQITPKRRFQGFSEALSGHAQLILGTRLSVFAPLKRLGLIVVDEEHDPSYRQHEGVRYSARDLAVWRARQWQIPIVLGSATPSLESWKHAESGQYVRLSMTQRAHAQARLPRIGLINVGPIKTPDGLSPPLLRGLEARLAAGEQSLVFLNRRGYAPVLSCPSCAWVSPCPHCSAHQVVHRNDRRLRCHHCGAQAPIPRACPSCGNQDLQAWGQGTQRVEESLARHFPKARVLRLDRDTAGTKGRWEALLAQVAQGAVDIVVGTQMLSKGHDFPKVTLVGIIEADNALFSSDFRAAERLFAQLMQVGGRAGRAEHPGEVLIQTRHPTHPLFRCLQTHDYPGFAARLLEERKLALFPPFSFQALLCVQAPRVEEALAFLEVALVHAQTHATPAVHVYAPVPMRMIRLAARERAQLLVESANRQALHRFLLAWGPALHGLTRSAGLSWHLDIDPSDL